MDSEFEEYTSPPPDTSGAWMLTFADLLSLIITFFVMLFSMTTIEEQQWENIVRSLSQRLRLEQTTDMTPPAAELSIEKEEVAKAVELPYLHGILTQKLAEAGMAKVAKVEMKHDRVIISFAGQEAFHKGSVTMEPAMEQGMAQVAQFIRHIGNRVEINGNADPTPLQGKAYPSNWELSLDRARVVGDYLKAQGYPSPIRVYGRGASGYFEIPPQKDREERDRISRRIDIVIRSERANADVRLFP